ncbi:MAG: hypothetical protein KR126chlam2_00785 [Chlamydiae bacterium]|nr:hypothetical protein [Chlamydiota bacterium]
MAVEATERRSQFIQTNIQESIPEICRLPYELWLVIASHLTGKDLISLAGTCKAFRLLEREPSLWQLLCEKGPFRGVPEGENPKEAYIRRTTEILQNADSSIAISVNSDTSTGSSAAVSSARSRTVLRKNRGTLEKIGRVKSFILFVSIVGGIVAGFTTTKSGFNFFSFALVLMAGICIGVCSEGCTDSR